MSIELIQAVESVLSHLVQEVDKGASVLVQFAAGDWNALKEAHASAKQSMAGAEAATSVVTENPHSEATESPTPSAPAAPIDPVIDEAPTPAPDSYLPPGV